MGFGDFGTFGTGTRDPSRASASCAVVERGPNPLDTSPTSINNIYVGPLEDPAIYNEVPPIITTIVTQAAEDTITVYDLAWLEKAWQVGNVAGAVVTLYDQDYLLVKRVLLDKPLVIAAPTFDGSSFVPLTDTDIAYFRPNAIAQELLTKALLGGQYKIMRGAIFPLGTVLFPVVTT